MWVTVPKLLVMCDGVDKALDNPKSLTTATSPRELSHVDINTLFPDRSPCKISFSCKYWSADAISRAVAKTFLMEAGEVSDGVSRSIPVSKIS